MTFNENTNRNKARTWTIVIHVLLLLWFAFTGLKYQDPPPEEGIAINFGYEETGKGDNSQAAAVTPPPPTPVETPLAAPVAQEEVITQDTEDAPVIEKPKEKTVEETPKEPVEETPEEKPVVEPDSDPQPTAEQIEQQAQQDKLDRMFNTNNKGTGTGEGLVTIVYRLFDQFDYSPEARVTLNIVGKNKPPVVRAGFANTLEDSGKMYH